MIASLKMKYCQSLFSYKRRNSRLVSIGGPEGKSLVIGGQHPVLPQSMITSDTLDTDASVQQVEDLVAVHCPLVRITAQTVRHAANLREIVTHLRERGIDVPIVADIHFKPEAAMEAVKWVEVIRVNPGNFADSKKFAIREYTDDQYETELEKVKSRFEPLVLECLKRNRALRIGTNHGSLSDRIMNRFGDTPLGMVESALEFAQIARAQGFHNFKFSMKSSNPKVMIQCYRLLAARLMELGEDWNYPLHLGVTEAGEGEDGRIKSAIGIGSLLCDGLGDTIRVSLTEDSPHEIAVCHDLINQIPQLVDKGLDLPELTPAWDPFNYQRLKSKPVSIGHNVIAGGEQTVRVLITQDQSVHPEFRVKPGSDVQPEGVYEDLDVIEVDPREPIQIDREDCLVTVKDDIGIPAIAAFRLLACRLSEISSNNPILLKDTLQPLGPTLTSAVALLRSSVVLGALLADGIGDAILVRQEPHPTRALNLAYNILQAAGCRSFKTDYVACPSCGRTLFNLQDVTAKIKNRTEHLKGVKIAVMGCIVNGPGEMADADFGYVGGAPGKINLYVGKTPVKFNIPEEKAVDELVELIAEHGKWMEPVCV